MHSLGSQNTSVTKHKVVAVPESESKALECWCIRLTLNQSQLPWDKLSTEELIGKLLYPSENPSLHTTVSAVYYLASLQFCIVATLFHLDATILAHSST